MPLPPSPQPSAESLQAMLTRLGISSLEELAAAQSILAELEAEEHPRPSLLYSPHQPTSPQKRFLETLRTPTEFDPETREPLPVEALYGGSAGGGKSDALLMAALEYVHVPGYAALILRKSYEDLSLPGAIMDRANDWLRGTDAHPHDGGKSWTFPSGASLTFSYMQNDADRYRYQGAAFNFVGFDELTQFTEIQYKYLISRTRREVNGPIGKVPLRVASASNPGGVGHDWVYQRFFVEGRPFVPAKLVDNPHLDQRSYRRQLEQLDHITRAQLLHGDWEVRPDGGLFKRDWFRVIERPAPNILGQMRRCRYWDLAATEDPRKQGPKRGDPDYTVGVMLGLLEGQWYVLDVIRGRWGPAEVERVVKQTAMLDGREVMIRMEQEPGSSGVHVISHYAQRILTGYDFQGDKKTGNKIEYAKPVSAAAENGLVHVVRAAWTGDFLDETVAFPQVAHDDQVDATSGAFRHLADLTGAGLEDWPDDLPRASRRF